MHSDDTRRLSASVRGRPKRGVKARFSISGRTALVTGGSAGIGLAITRLLIDQGCMRVLVVGRNGATLASIAAESERVTTLGADLSDSADIDMLLDRLPRLAPDLSLLVNNAGSQLLTDFCSATPTDALPALRAEIGVNLSAAVMLSVGLLPLLSRQPSAAIVNVTSGLALTPKKSSPVYCATKAGLRSFTRALRYQCEDRLPHVHVVEALPPLVDTRMTRGRGSAKISAEVCAAKILAGLKAGKTEIYVGKSKLLRAIMRLSPALGQRIVRDG